MEDAERDSPRPAAEKSLETRLRAALGVFDGPDWQETAVKFLTAYAKIMDGRKSWDVSTVGRRIRTARELAGLSQRQLALRLKVSGLEVSGWENERRDLPSVKLKPLCLILKISSGWLLGETEEGAPEVRRGILRKELPERLTKWRRQRDAQEKAKAEAAKRNAAYAAKKACKATGVS